MFSVFGVPLLGWLLVNIRFPYKDELDEICLHAAFFLDNYPSFLHVRHDKVQAFVDICREEFANLEAEAQAELLRLRQEGQLSRALSPHGYTSPGAPDVDACTAAWNLKPLDEVLSPDVDVWRQMYPEVLPLRERTVRVEEINTAFDAAEVVRFDARELLPPELFNISLKDLAALDPTPGETEVFEVPPYMEPQWVTTMVLWLLNRRLPMIGLNTPLAALAMKVLVPLAALIPQEPHLKLSDVSKWELRQHEVPFSTIVGTPPEAGKVLDHTRRLSRTLCSSNINARRLPDFAKGVNVLERLGLADEVVYMMNMLWFGSTPGGWHTDLQDNILIQLTEEAEFFAVPTNCSLRFASHGGVDQWLHQLSAMRKNHSKVPVFHITLKPGEGVAVPGNTLHKVLSRKGSRVGINYFFEPKYRRLQRASGAYKGLEPGYLAMRVLWLKSIAALWDKRRIRMAMHTVRMEVV